MPVVFVHGVNTRHGPGYEAGKLATEAFLKRHLTGATVGGKKLAKIQKVWFPYWGGLATTFAWNMASLPQGEMQALGGTAGPDLQPLVAHGRDALPGELGPEPLTALAKKRLSLAVDVLTQLALDNATPGTEGNIAAFVVRASAYAEAHPSPAWLAGVSTDRDLIARLGNELDSTPDVQALGGLGTVWSTLALASLRLKQAVLGIAGKAVDRGGDFASTKLLAWSRDSLNAVLGRFFGDIFIYLNGRGDHDHPGPIPQVILHDFEEARQAYPDEPFVVIGHSLGGVITFDLLSHFRPDLDVDLFVSVGSQVAHFEEMKLYRASNKAVRSPQRAHTPGNVKHWINVYDEVDIFSYAAKGVFDRVDFDSRYDTQTYTIKAHGAYFEQDRFYGRLRARVDELK